MRRGQARPFIATSRLRRSLSLTTRTFSRSILDVSARFFLVLQVFIFASSSLWSADYEEARQLFRTGKYDEAMAVAQAEVDRGVWNELWPRLLLESQLMTGRYEEALLTYEKSITKFSNSLRLRMLGAEVYRWNNKSVQAKEQLAVIPELLQRMPWRYSGKDELVPLGQYFVTEGEDPKKVLELCFDQALKEDPKLVEAHVASARLALAKHDDQVASQSLKKALQLDDSDPEIFFLLAKSWSNSDAEKATEYLRKSIELNPVYIPSLLYQAESRIDAEDYATAELALKEVEKVNAKHPMLWALRAVIAHFEGRYKEEGEHRSKALSTWALNPEVDHVIGRMLSQHYRFRESVQYQRRALEMDPNFVPAQSQLAQDLLRLGETVDGWKVVDRVRTQDPYDVSIFNRKQLLSRLAKFDTLETEGFVVRMDAREAKIFGNEVLDLLRQARRTLTEKYAVELEEPIFVEIFPRQKEFAIRTFGMPGGEGFLGVCFGRLITANSPTALQVDSNWKSVLWHEYCHVITLQKSKNKMPRWLSEGISVYEERQRNATWGQSMDPTYREMILGEDLVPVSKLSGAFLSPKSPMHLQFAYYQSSMVVEYWVEKYGLDKLQRVLEDSSVGMPINESLARYSGGIEALDAEFETYIRELAKNLSPDVDFSKTDMPKDKDPEVLTKWIQSNPNNYWAIRTGAQMAFQTKQLDRAVELAQQWIKLYPNDTGEDGPYRMLALIHEQRGDTELEEAMLRKIAERTPDCTDTLLRLMEMERQRQNWDQALEWCQRLIEIQPMKIVLHETKAMAAENLHRHDSAAEALSALLELDPIDPAGIHFRNARALHAVQRPLEAKRQVLRALEESPRYTEALSLLLEIQAAIPNENPSEDSIDSSQEASKESGL